jgi:cyclopropane fatty-acyl-phospholipid synthase-like methyltransferase
MERAEWLKQMREMTEALYDHVSPEYWVKFGFYENEAQLEHLQKFLARVSRGGTILSAACGAGRYDGLLLEAGHSVTGIDQSAGMLARAKEHFPEARYEKMGLQDIDFHEAFDGAICMDALEHVCPEDWPGIMKRFRKALKPGGRLYFTVEVPDEEEVKASYERVQALDSQEVQGELADVTVYHYYPSREQVREWIEQAGLVIEEKGKGNGYEHYIVRRKQET